MINPISIKIDGKRQIKKNSCPLIDKATQLSFFSGDSKAAGESKEPKNFLELLFGNFKTKHEDKTKTKKIKKLTPYEAKLYAQVKDKNELDDFIRNYEPILKL